MGKKTHTFILSDESVNRHGFRVLTDGIALDAFKSNPIMFWLHKRDNKWNETSLLPIGIWKNIRIEDNKLLADAEFDQDDEFSMKIAKKVEKGHIRMASVGIEPTELSEATEHIMQGQKLATVTKCELIEASIVDIGSNKNALRLYNNNSMVELSALSQHIPQIQIKQNKKMDEIIKKLNLAHDAKESQVVEAITGLMTKNQQLSADISTKDKEIETLNKKVIEFNQAKIKNLVNQAIADKRFGEDMRATYEEMAAENYERAEKIINSLPKVGRVIDDLEKGKGQKELNWDQLYKEGKLEELKKNDFESFKQLYKDKFKKEYV